ncbi:MAG TPA: class I SAM-dependent methyltransferase, partial [Mucilaginibacter sp.]
DRLARLVYGRAIIDTQLFLINHIQPGSHILIVGGGTGWILDELSKIYTAGLTITYVEVAGDMMALSKKRNIAANKIIFINNAVENVKLPADFDVVLTPFLFDNFKEDTFRLVFDHINKLLKPGGLWLNCDFEPQGKWWQSFLLNSMFVFFRLICRIEADKLPDISARFNLNAFSVINEKLFFGGFIIARVYSK